MAGKFHIHASVETREASQSSSKPSTNDRRHEPHFEAVQEHTTSLAATIKVTGSVGRWHTVKPSLLVDEMPPWRL